MIAPSPPIEETRKSKPLGRSRWWRGAAVVVVAGMVGAGAGATTAEFVSDPAASAASDTAVQQADIGAAKLDVPALLARVLPGVVSIQTANAAGGQGAGTGMVISPAGEVLTNWHVVEGSTSITVTRYGTTKALQAGLVGAVPAQDLALLQIEGARDLPAVTLGDSAAAPVGSAVIAVGNALGLSPGTPTVTEGIVSATGRTVTTSSHGRERSLEAMLQTDAAINPGNSGGPLFDAAGSVIGVNTAVAAGSGETVAQGIGFAIPIDHAKDLLPEMRKGGTRGGPSAYLGVTSVTVTPAIRAAYGLVPDAGVLITGVSAASPAARAGLWPGDVLVEVDGKPMASSAQLAELVAGSKPGRQLHVQLVRGATTTTVAPQLSAPPLSAG